MAEVFLVVIEKAINNKFVPLHMSGFIISDVLVERQLT